MPPDDKTPAEQFRALKCEGCGVVEALAPGCELPAAWGMVGISKCWEGSPGHLKRGEFYVHAQKVLCRGCLFDMREAYRARRHLTEEQKRKARREGEPSVLLLDFVPRADGRD